jgi:hypothetical protein
MPLIGGALSPRSLSAMSGTSRAPQLLQKTPSIGFGVLHIGQIKPVGKARRAPQLLQNLLLSLFCVPH